MVHELPALNLTNMSRIAEYKQPVQGENLQGGALKPEVGTPRVGSVEPRQQVSGAGFSGASKVVSAVSWERPPEVRDEFNAGALLENVPSYSKKGYATQYWIA